MDNQQDVMIAVDDQASYLILLFFIVLLLKQTVAVLRNAIQERMGVPSGEQRLILRGRLLNDDSQTVQGVVLRDQDVLHLIHQVPRIQGDNSTELNGQRQMNGTSNRFNIRLGMRIIELGPNDGQQQRGNGGRGQEASQQNEGTPGHRQQIEIQGSVSPNENVISDVLAVMLFGEMLRAMSK